MASVCNAWKSQSTKWTGMLFLRFVLILSVEEKWLSMCNRNLHDCIHISIPVPFRFGHLLLLLLFLFDFYITFYNYKKPITVNQLTSLQLENTSIIEMNINWKFLQIYNPYIFMELKRPLNWLKRWNNKDRRKLKRNCKTLFKVKCIQISCKKCQTLDLSAIEG